MTGVRKKKISRRTLARLVACPECGSPAGVACLGKKGARKSVHRARLGIKPPAVALIPPPTDNFYLSDEWRSVRYEALRRHGGMCQCCGKRPTLRLSLHVDHIKPRSRFPHLALDVNNLQVLCVDCNLGKGARDQTDWRRAG